MAAASAIGFEGFEKRLEITFSEPPIFADPNGLGLRALSRPDIDSLLEPACCTIVSHLSNTELDSYVLSESSLFVYPFKIIMKTCGTTKLLHSIPQILKLAESISLSARTVRYSRGTFIFEDSQPSPHRTFTEEVEFLNSFFDSGSAYLLGDPRFPNRNWHVYVAAVAEEEELINPTAEVNLEMCMTGLDREKAAVFFKNSGSEGRMTEMSLINEITPSHQICDFEFDPCGYSMNAIEGAAYSTVHVTPEEGFSYASYEAMGLNFGLIELGPLLSRVLGCFGPDEFSVAITCMGGGGAVEELWSADVEGYTCRGGVAQPLPGGGCVVYWCFKANKERVGAARAAAELAMRCWKEVAGQEAEMGGAAAAVVTTSFPCVGSF
ncbi:S-adenosylmethionine decarboxylase [Perilla frutescens var. hirtella]|uniref:S-adenosylmethionine decarboxylase proenzyme n=1 Tax=Perilla frutescens var. hirtella TaxID=608512 RepID=A0AAD4P6L2_PERFH|nr:S-adenosylmethionine decarboxylase [Perilla frutescens var. hirtella]